MIEFSTHSIPVNPLEITPETDAFGFYPIHYFPGCFYSDKLCFIFKPRKEKIMKGKNQGSISGAKQTTNINKQKTGTAKPSSGGKANFNQKSISGGGKKGK